MSPIDQPLEDALNFLLGKNKYIKVQSLGMCGLSIVVFAAINLASDISGNILILF